MPGVGALWGAGEPKLRALGTGGAEAVCWAWFWGLQGGQQGCGPPGRLFLEGFMLLC